MLFIFFILVVIVLIEGIYRPRFDKTREGDLLLWYGKKHRTYIKLN